jgi:hypothetical protein
MPQVSKPGGGSVMSFKVEVGLGTSTSDLPECVSRWLLEHKARVKGFMLRNGEERFYSFDLLQPITHPKEYCKDDKALRDTVAIREIITIEGSSAFVTFLAYYVNALYDPMSSCSFMEFKVNYGLFKRLLREYEREYQERMREAENLAILKWLLPVR